tara:strand:- start:1642 stop:1863 length:222 start_codon:yes stop_codon:yes gene_type:complete
MTYTAKKTRHKYSERYKLVSEDGARGEVELWDEGDWRVRFGSLIGSTKYSTMDEAAAVVFRCHREAVERICVV